MTKRIGHQRKGQRARQKPKIKRKPVIVICALISLATAVGIAARWKILPGTSKPMMLQPAPTAGSLAANSPSKEYIYAGGRLIATEEPQATSSATPTPSPTATPTPPPTPTPSPDTPQNVVWTRPFYVQATGNNLTKAEGTDWDAGAVSTKAIQSGSGYIEFTAAGEPAEVMCGLSHGDSNPYYTDIDFAVHLESGGAIKIREGGVYIGTFGSYQIGDRFRVAIDGGVVKYYKIPLGTSETPLPAPFYTSTIAPSYPLLFDTSIYAVGGTVSNAVISGQLADSFPQTRINVARAEGATAHASSTMNNDEDSFGAGYVNDGDTAGNSGWWADNTPISPGTPDTDYLDITFAGSRTINEVDVFGLQENYTNPSEPTLEMTSRFALTDLNIQYWTGAAWAAVPGASATNNNHVWTKFSFTSLATTKIRVNVTRVASDNHSQIVEVEAWQPQGYGVNVALSSQGATITASSTSQSAGYGEQNCIDGNKRSSTWWQDNTSNAYPDSVEIQFSGSKSISEIDVTGVQENYTDPSEPTAEMTSRFALTIFKVQYWTGTSWLSVPGGEVTGNDRVWRKFTFTPVTTGKIRIYVTGVAGDNHTNVMEVEAYQQ